MSERHKQNANDIQVLFSPVVQKVTDDEREGRVLWRLLSLAINRYGYVVKPDGIIIEDFVKNNVVLWSHDHERPAIGTIDINSFKITPKYVDAVVVFDLISGDSFAEMVYEKVKNGVINAGSIAFKIITSSEEPLIKGQSGPSIIKWELWEFTICNIPALPDAIAKRQMIAGEFMEYRNFAKHCGYWDSDLDDILRIDDSGRDAIIKVEKFQNYIKEIELKHADLLDEHGKMRSNHIHILEELGRIKHQYESLKRLLPAY